MGMNGDGFPRQYPIHLIVDNARKPGTEGHVV
jgi:hypothetical protein